VLNGLVDGSSLKTLSTVNDPTPSNAFNAGSWSDVDLSELVRLRFDHQTKQAATGVRKAGNPTTNVQDTTMAGHTKLLKPLTERQKVLREFNQIIKQQGDQGVGTGADRKKRWETNTTAQGNSNSSLDTVPVHGNAANAEAAAKATATKVCTKFFSTLLCLLDAEHCLNP
jgi:hypothetical protein